MFRKCTPCIPKNCPKANCTPCMAKTTKRTNEKVVPKSQDREHPSQSIPFGSEEEWGHGGAAVLGSRPMYLQNSISSSRRRCPAYSSVSGGLHPGPAAAAGSARIRHVRQRQWDPRRCTPCRVAAPSPPPPAGGRRVVQQGAVARRVEGTREGAASTVARSTGPPRLATVRLTTTRPERGRVVLRCTRRGRSEGLRTGMLHDQRNRHILGGCRLRAEACHEAHNLSRAKARTKMPLHSTRFPRNVRLGFQMQAHGIKHSLIMIWSRQLPYTN